VLAPFRDILDQRRRAGGAAGAFTCYDVTTAVGVVRAAEGRGLPAILLVAEASFRAPTGRLLVPALRAVADEASVPMCVQLDHVSDDALIDAALAAGVGAVMADGSRLPLDENTAFVAAVRDRAGSAGIEVELGHIEGGEDIAAATEAGVLTDPDDAVSLVVATRCDCLAVSIGNVHGRYASPPRLDWARLTRIRGRIDIPLSLHGASGLPDSDVRRAVELGVCKVNVNAEIRQGYLTRLADRLPAALDGLRLLELEAAVVDAVGEVVTAKLELLEGIPSPSTTAVAGRHSFPDRAD
jgi:ketose-bisphosphate aldolase